MSKQHLRPINKLIDNWFSLLITLLQCFANVYMLFELPVFNTVFNGKIEYTLLVDVDLLE